MKDGYEGRKADARTIKEARRRKEDGRKDDATPRASTFARLEQATGVRHLNSSKADATGPVVNHFLSLLRCIHGICSLHTDFRSCPSFRHEVRKVFRRVWSQDHL